jgi:hypothetical protein
MPETKTLANPHAAHAAQHAAGHTVAAVPAAPSRGTQTLRFLRHFGEMVVAMLLGMVAFAGLNGALLMPLGLGALFDAPEAGALAMAGAMTLPMVAWMRIRGHIWRLTVEMAAAMIVPTVLLIALSALGLLPRMSLMLGTHLLMLPAMLAVMLPRWRDYTCH